jgi:hypothetical protein
MANCVNLRSFWRRFRGIIPNDRHGALRGQNEDCRPLDVPYRRLDSSIAQLETAMPMSSLLTPRRRLRTRKAARRRRLILTLKKRSNISNKQLIYDSRRSRTDAFGTGPVDHTGGGPNHLTRCGLASRKITWRVLRINRTEQMHVNGSEGGAATCIRNEAEIFSIDCCEFVTEMADESCVAACFYRNAGIGGRGRMGANRARRSCRQPDDSREGFVSARCVAPGRLQGGSVADDHEKNLSDKLDASGGMIKPPPGVDPEIVKPAPVPEPNSTPVIPPPGVPGGPPGRRVTNMWTAVSFFRWYAKGGNDAALTGSEPGKVTPAEPSLVASRFASTTVISKGKVSTL